MSKKIKITVASVIAALVIIEGALAFFTVREIFSSPALPEVSDNAPAMPQGEPGGNGGSVSYSAAETLDKDQTVTEGEYKSEKADENALLVTDKAQVTLENVKITKTGDSDGGDTTSFYGTNSALLAKDGAVVTVKNAEITTEADGANGVFSYGGSETTQNALGDGTVDPAKAAAALLLT